MKRKNDNRQGTVLLYAICCTLVFFAVFISISYLRSLPSLPVTITISAAYIILTLLGGLYIKNRNTKRSRADSFLSKKLLDELTEFAESTLSPIAVFDKNGNLLSSNAAFDESVASHIDLGSNKWATLSEAIRGVLQSEEDAVVTIGSGTNEKCYEVSLKLDKKSRSTRVFTLWQDKSELLTLHRRIEAGRTVYGYIVVDSFEESFIDPDSQYSDATEKARKLIHEWIKEIGGAVSDLAIGQYAVVFRYEKLDEIRASKFEIHERVKSVRYAQTNDPVTVSCGFASINGSDAENMKKAQEALALAVRSGRNQTVLIINGEGTDPKNDKIENFGGNTKSSVLLSRKDIQRHASNLAKKIKESSNVVIMGHKNIDFDCIGACIGIYRLASYYIGTENVKIVVNLPKPGDSVRRKDKNLDDSLKLLGEREEYSSAILDRDDVTGDIFTSDTLLIIADASSNDVIEKPELIDCAEKVAYIDHHIQKDQFPKKPIFTLMGVQASSTCELVAYMLEHLWPAVKLLENEATLMLAGIILDTNHFRRNTSRNTFFAAQYLMSERASSERAASLFASSVADYKYELEYEKHVRIMYDRFAISVKKSDGTQNDFIPCARVADRLLTVEGIIASFAMFCLVNESTGEKTVVISARSLGPEKGIKTADIVQALSPNGGGDYEKGGARVVGKTVEEAERMLRDAITRYYQTHFVTESSDA